MKSFKIIKPREIEGNPFQMIGSDWMLVTAEDGEKVNTMTASWGGVGVMWEMNVATIVVRPSRYTKVFVDAAETFSLSFLDRSYRKQLNYLGTVSGRDEPKIEKSGLTVVHAEIEATKGRKASRTPYFEESSLVLICRKVYQQVYDPAGFIDPTIARNYPTKDYHTSYIAEIIQVLKADET